MSKTHEHTENPQEWIAHFASLRSEQYVPKLQTVIDLYDANHAALLQKALNLADILLHLGLDTDALVAALLYPLVQNAELHLDMVTDRFGVSVNKLLQNILHIQSLSKFQQAGERSAHQIENLRKMLLAIVSDVRVVLMVLAERLWLLREAKKSDQQTQEKLASETLDLYAPLANRLGVWQLKWEIEDCCLRYLQPDHYKEIAKGLAARRAEREEYVAQMIAGLHEILQKTQIKKAEVHGRVKHIYSIYRKMQQKKLSLNEIYDITAIRVLVETLEDCYTVLSEIQNHWQQIPEEFDDYIARPKPNGYRSIHMVIVGPHQRVVEIQIRTFEMHQESELGVAAHWRYKEGVLQTPTYEAKIALLRQLMAWQKEIAGDEKMHTQQKVQDVFADRIYVFTPQGDIIDLQKGATPLDFAYHIHSEIGHRCRGAKANGKMVPLTYQLQTGERVEILTAKEPNPSRDWLQVHYGYLVSDRARAKVAHWFRVKDNENEAETAQHLSPAVHHTPSLHRATSGVREEKKPLTLTGGIDILGINNLLTNMARCCKPKIGDAVVGYITRTRGISIHRIDCVNMVRARQANQQRFIDVRWSVQKK